MISVLIQLGVCGLALFGLVIAVAWSLGYIALVRWFELDQLKSRCLSLSSGNRELRAQIHHLSRLVRINEVAQRTTRAMLQVAAEERRTIEGRALDR